MRKRLCGAASISVGTVVEVMVVVTVVALSSSVLNACKSRAFNASVREQGGGQTNEQGSERAAGPEGKPLRVDAKRVETLRAGLSIVLPPAQDEKGLARLPRLADLGFSASRFTSLLTAALGDSPSQAEVEAGDVFNADTPRQGRTLTNEACVRNVSNWKLTHLQFLPYERLVEGSYTAISAFERTVGKRLLVPLAFRATFQPWCVSEKTPAKKQVFVLEQAIQIEWRTYDLVLARHILMTERVAEATEDAQRLAGDTHGALVRLAESFETPEAANARTILLGEVDAVASVPQGAAQGAERGRFELALGSFLKRRALFLNVHAIWTSLAESQGVPVHSRIRFDGDTARPVEMVTRQVIKRASRVEGAVPSGTDAFALGSLLALGRFVSAVDTGHIPKFDVQDASARATFDEVDIAPSLLATLPKAEQKLVGERIQDPNRMHKTTSHCTLCHGLGAPRILSGHTERGGAQVSALSSARAAQDASAFARELEKL